MTEAEKVIKDMAEIRKKVREAAGHGKIEMAFTTDMDTVTFRQKIFEQLEKMQKEFNKTLKAVIDEEFRDFPDLMQDAVQLALDERENYTKDFIRGILDEWWEEKVGSFEEMRERLRTTLQEEERASIKRMSEEVARQIDEQILKHLMKQEEQKDYQTYVHEDERRKVKKILRQA